MTRIALGVEYCGEDFFGFQIQANLKTVQATLEQALSRIADEPIALICAGRTDRGVHATGQVIHFDTKAVRPISAWLQGVNTYLPASLSVCWAREVDDQFHARFRAIARSYRYIIYNQSIQRAMLRHRVGFCRQPLNVAPMQEAAQYLLGEQDFTSFRSSQCQSNTPMRCINKITLVRQNDFVMCDITANAFLHHMVRNIVGTLILVGRGLHTTLWVKTVLEARNRALAGEMAPPEGLYLINVLYPEPYLFPPADLPFLV